MALPECAAPPPALPAPVESVNATKGKGKGQAKARARGEGGERKKKNQLSGCITRGFTIQIKRKNVLTAVSRCCVCLL